MEMFHIIINIQERHFINTTEELQSVLYLLLISEVFLTGPLSACFSRPTPRVAAVVLIGAIIKTLSLVPIWWQPRLMRSTFPYHLLDNPDACSSARILKLPHFKRSSKSAATCPVLICSWGQVLTKSVIIRYCFTLKNYLWFALVSFLLTSKVSHSYIYSCVIYPFNSNGPFHHLHSQINVLL